MRMVLLETKNSKEAGAQRVRVDRMIGSVLEQALRRAVLLGSCDPFFQILSDVHTRYFCNIRVLRKPVRPRSMMRGHEPSPFSFRESEREMA